MGSHYDDVRLDREKVRC